MRLDKFLKVSRIVKAGRLPMRWMPAGRIDVNGKQAKPGTDVKVGDALDIGFDRIGRVRILRFGNMYEKKRLPLYLKCFL